MQLLKCPRDTWLQVTSSSFQCLHSMPLATRWPVTLKDNSLVRCLTRHISQQTMNGRDMHRCAVVGPVRPVQKSSDARPQPQKRRTESTVCVAKRTCMSDIGHSCAQDVARAGAEKRVFDACCPPCVTPRIPAHEDWSLRRA